ncbi:flagellin N-terminal helical domain-containing protein [Pseudolysinimonas sp.]
MTRITSQMLTTAAQRNLAHSQAALARLQEQGSSGTKLAKPSDDPAATASALEVRSAQRAREVHERNANDALGWLGTVDTALGQSTDILRRVRDLTLQGSNQGVMSAESREALAVEIDALKDALLQQANTQYLGRSVFAANSLAGSAYAPDYTYSGVAGTSLERRIGPDSNVTVDGDGVAAFGQGATSVFALLDGISADLRAGTAVSSRVAELDSRMSAISTQRSIAGSRYAQVERGKDLLAMSKNELEARRAGLEDADLGQIIIDLKMQEVAYQAALSVTARAVPPTLLEFLA